VGDPVQVFGPSEVAGARFENVHPADAADAAPWHSDLATEPGRITCELRAPDGVRGGDPVGDLTTISVDRADGDDRCRAGLLVGLVVYTLMPQAAHCTSTAGSLCRTTWCCS